MSSKRKANMGIEHRLTKVETQHKALVEQLHTFMGDIKSEIEEVKRYVSNDLVHALDATNKDLKILLDRKQGSDAVKIFLTNFLKLSASIAGLTWATMQILHMIGH